MSTWPLAIGPTHSLSRYVSGALSNPPRSDAARTVIGVGEAHGDQVGALERVDGNVDLGLVGLARADLLADEQHRRLVALALADDDRAAHLDLVEGLAHRLDRGAIRGHSIAAAHVARRFDGRRLGDADHLEREQGFHD